MLQASFARTLPGAQAKHVPEGFLSEAVNALNGWGEELFGLKLQTPPFLLSVCSSRSGASGT